MNLILLYNDDFTNDSNRVVIKGRRLRHVIDVHRASEGDTLCVGLINGNIGHGIVVKISQAVMELDVHLETSPPPFPDLNLILALPRPKVLSRVIIAASSMGIKHIWLINAYRVEKSYWNSPRVTNEAITDSLTLGLEQAKDTIMPTVYKKNRFKPFVEDELPAIIRETTPYVAHPGGGIPCPRGVKGAVTLAIGPEGGFIPYETDKLRECGFIPVHLGERILRVESAVPALLGRIL